MITVVLVLTLGVAALGHLQERITDRVGEAKAEAGQWLREHAGFPDPVARPAPSPRMHTAEAALARAQLGELRVAGRAPKTGYTREAFGPAWADVDGNGCDTRNDILRRDLDLVAVRRDGCTVRRGVLADPYTGARVTFTRGPDNGVDIDHVVALGDAWQKGARGWPAAARQRFANDPANLLAVTAAANRQKGDGDTATWLPPNKAFRCRYVATQISVKHRYRLWVTPAEQAAMRRVLARC